MSMKTFRRNRVEPMAMVMFLILTLLFSCSGSDNSSGPQSGLSDLEQIQQEIIRTGKKWTAGHTIISDLSDEEKEAYFGELDPDGDAGSEVAETYAANERATIPASYDWRNVSGSNYVTPVKNQAWNYLTNAKGKCGSCWAFSSTAALESQVLIQANTPISTTGSALNLSEQIMVSCSGVGTCKGGRALKAAQYMQTTGLLPSTCFVYQAQDLSCSQACSGWSTNSQTKSTFSNVYTIKGDTTKSTCDVNTKCYNMKSAIATTGPIVVSFNVMKDFQHYTSGVYDYVETTSATPSPTPSATPGATPSPTPATTKKSSGHAVLAVGYDDTGKYFIVKNSWGTSWGESGFFRISYDMVSNKDVKFGGSAIGFNQPKASSSTN